MDMAQARFLVNILVDYTSFYILIDKTKCIESFEGTMGQSFRAVPSEKEETKE